jgi:hypothetical protein
MYLIRLDVMLENRWEQTNQSRVVQIHKYYSRRMQVLE